MGVDYRILYISLHLVISQNTSNQSSLLRAVKLNSTQEMFEELCVGFDFSPSLVKEQEQQATSSILCRSEEPALSVAEARTMLTLKAGAVQKVVGCLQPSFHGRSISVTTFPCVYQAFYPTPEVLD
nr:PREDICTED: ral guanine nucleotide dissociation stimulator-like isoform X5 [Equus przewalskii]